MKKKIIAAILLPLVTVFSCTKETSKIQENQDEQLITLSASSQDWSAAANSSNPYDYVGIEHNKAAKHIVENVSYGNLTNAQTNYNTGKAYVAANFDNSIVTNFNSNTSSALLGSIFNNFGKDLPTVNTYTPIINANTSLSSTAKSYFNSLLNQMFDPNNTSLDYSFYKSIIVNWESGIANLSVSNDDKKALYMSASVMRHSLLLWKDVEYPDSGDENLQLMKFRIKLWGWIATGVADAAVAIGAAAVLTPVGSAVLAGCASAGVAGVCGINNW